MRPRLMGARTYFYVVALREGGEAFLGPYRTREEANAKGYITGSYFEVYEFNTRDPARATQMYKEGKLKRVLDIDKSLERVSHTTEDRRRTRPG